MQSDFYFTKEVEKREIKRFKYNIILFQRFAIFCHNYDRNHFLWIAQNVLHRDSFKQPAPCLTESPSLKYLMSFVALHSWTLALVKISFADGGDWTGDKVILANRSVIVFWQLLCICRGWKVLWYFSSMLTSSYGSSQLSAISIE